MSTSGEFLSGLCRTVRAGAAWLLTSVSWASPREEFEEITMWRWSFYVAFGECHRETVVRGVLEGHTVQM